MVSVIRALKRVEWVFLLASHTVCKIQKIALTTFCKNYVKSIDLIHNHPPSYFHDFFSKVRVNFSFCHTVSQSPILGIGNAIEKLLQHLLAWHVYYWVYLDREQFTPHLCYYKRKWNDDQVRRNRCTHWFLLVLPA